MRYLNVFSCDNRNGSLLSNSGGWCCWLGRWVQCAECLLALLTFIRAYRKPPDTKDLQSALFSLAKTLPKHTAPLPHSQNATPTVGLTDTLGTTLILFIHFGFNAVGRLTHLSF